MSTKLKFDGNFHGSIQFRIIYFEHRYIFEIYLQTMILIKRSKKKSYLQSSECLVHFLTYKAS